jgi:5-hydroxyisourate hydrolase-like protein (transthyretin family)
VVCGEWDLNSSNGTFNDLSGGREMDIGYDIRGDRLYVSYFWNESSQIEVKLNQLHNPRITSEGVAQGYAYVDYSSVINCTAPDNGSTLWSLETDASWLTIGSSNDTSCNVTGLSSDWGVYYANLTASDGNDTVYLNWSITITRMKVVSGHVLNETNGPIAGLLVTVTIRDGSVDRTLKVNTTDSNGFYTVTFINDEWFVDDTIIVGAYYSNRSEENATLATTELEQEVNLQFIPIIPEFGALKMALVVCSVGVLVAAVAHYWRRRRSLKSV